MRNWPTADDIFWLVVGLLPFLWVAWRAVSYGRHELVSLGTFGVAIMWVGYHLKPWLGLPQSGWTSFLLREEFVTEGIRYSALAMIAFILGYAFLAPAGRSAVRIADLMPRARVQVVLGLTVITAVLVVIARGGPSELWAATLYRGEGQFGEKDLLGRLQNIVRIASAFVSFVTAGMGALLIVQSHGPAKPHVWIVGFLAILSASLGVMSGFSRGAGFAFGLLATVQMLHWRRSRIPLIVAALVVASWFSWTGYTQRGVYLPGVSNFVAALVDARPVASGTGRKGTGWIDPNNNFLDALDPWTARAWTRERVQPSLWEGMKGAVAVLQPLPSQFVPFNVRAGESLSKWLGTWGSTGLTTPALGELYYLLGYPGLVLVAALGLFAGWAQRKFLQGSRNGASVILYFATLFGFVLGLHGGLRTMTRPMLYGWAVVVVCALARKVNQPPRRFTNRHAAKAKLGSWQTLPGRPLVARRGV